MVYNAHTAALQGDGGSGGLFTWKKSTMEWLSQVTVYGKSDKAVTRLPNQLPKLVECQIRIRQCNHPRSKVQISIPSSVALGRCLKCAIFWYRPTSLTCHVRSAWARSMPMQHIQRSLTPELIFTVGLDSPVMSGATLLGGCMCGGKCRDFASATHRPRLGTSTLQLLPRKIKDSLPPPSPPLLFPLSTLRLTLTLTSPSPSPYLPRFTHPPFGCSFRCCPLHPRQPLVASKAFPPPRLRP